ncbi:competence protein CoiA family protein [Bacillus sp. B190/17]|uniref:Competence protein CoiA family protein n=1 Tax=Bacillus lumedeiriae TaxID=3058829 RepID=A0ABW8I8K9_9BACI
MLVAVDQYGQAVSLANRPNEQLIHEVRSSRHFCPSCRQPVILKAGAIKIPHFAHASSHACEAFSEGESERHLKGKADMHNWIRRTHEVEMEAYLPEISQRPDLLVDGKVAMEYQCSHMSVDLFVNRTEGYKQNGLFPFWIYGGPPIKKRAQLYHFSVFHRLFFQYSPLFGFWFLSYCPDRELFILYSQLIPVQSSLYFASVQMIPLHSLPYPPSFAKTSGSFLTLSDWFRQKQHWLQKQLYFRQGLYHPFLSTVYKTGHNPFLLPPWVGVPIRFMALIKNHPVEWQFYLWNDLLVHKPKAESKEAAAVLQERVRKGDLQLNMFPLFSFPTLLDLIEEYLLLFQSIGAMNEKESKTTLEQMEKERRFTEDFEELIMTRLIF